MVFGVTDNSVAVKVFAKFVDISGANVGLSLLNKKLSDSMNPWNERSTFEAISCISDELKHITIYGKRPKIKVTENHHQLLKLLTRKGYLNSYKEEGDFYRVFNKSKQFIESSKHLL